ncbi:phage tail family protein [Streptomyces sp. NBS 14/10]|uniref:phage distal tail protein n=1 Tax=Streptomyces sp. NBS 14/10 TaxID=1945643 RepID=UPI000B7DDC6C|nr:phage tail domain-containing protein [Streptomyces sp. NBS 14/10]KAK1184891.1 phage tail family protein [Streptomyces sp. NBS 14/10]NUP45477.1 phage tail protein [Streptomyces sp.]NUS85887.1 phage tail protein [Streptomyces sp.]
MASETITAAEPGPLITADGQVQWAGLLMGPGTDYWIAAEGLTGWEELPALDTSDADRPVGHGGWPGSQWAQARTVTAQVWFAPDPDSGPEGVREALRALRLATAVRDEEEWLAVRLHGETLAVRARVTQRVVPTDRQFAASRLAKMTLQWKAGDPRRYEAVGRRDTVGLPQREPGLTWPLVWPLAWGAPGATGDLTVENGGSAPAHPVITFTGPCTRPRLANRAGGDWLEYAITLAPDDELVVDTAEGTVMFNGTASRRHTAVPGSAPEESFTLPPGTSQLSFRAASGGAGATATIDWRRAEW